MALERGGQLRLPVACDDGIHNTFEGGVRGSQGGELPEKGLEDGWGHGKDLVKVGTCCGPGEDCAPVAPRLEPGGRGSAEGCDNGGEGLTHPVNGHLRTSQVQTIRTIRTIL